MRVKPQTRAFLMYLAVAGLWIWLSDRALSHLISDPNLLALLQSIKGFVFVLATGILLYLLIDREMRRLAQANKMLLRGHEQSLRVLVSAMDIRHKETRDHSERVMRMTVALARLAGMGELELQHAKFGALLHDIGKLALPDAILIKPGPLDAQETRVMRTHPQIGHDLLQRVDFLRPVVDIPFNHHERWDGTGYPRGLRGEAIPLAARVFSVVDVWDALSFPRVYKPAWPEPKVLAYLRDAAGTQLDPRMVALFLDHYAELKHIGLAASSVAPVTPLHAPEPAHH
ncbi:MULTISPECIES: HD-GYP domain-containing protein [Dyella]|uniref:HD-GYP domain-containing protein n=2 Tax=Dyella TaxID=231454 RepID=A0A4R0YTR6_9GAMM|nr:MULTISPECIES: HD-GYP domain-containing protein [Dyella]TBR39635.1 HD-GYP domain-containing protein [Dyella terrae]TCI12783.1 HD-GYP domain-containing protein [Dyella soli]